MAVHLGQTFVTPQAPGVLPHLWMVLSDPSRGERYLRFAEVRVADRGSLEKLLTTAQLRPSHDLTPDLLRRIQVAVAASKVVPIEAARIPTAQGLV